MPKLLQWFIPLLNGIITCIMWFVFIINFFIIFIPACLLHLATSRNIEYALQSANHYYFKLFFIILQAITPGLVLNVSDEVKQLRSSVIVSNHISYLDPILFISVFKYQKTIVKNTFLKFPIMGWVLRFIGYIPAENNNDNSLFINRLHNLKQYIAQGGILFVFPEGKRSRNGKMATFKKGAFTIAKKINAPISIIRIENTNRLFIPGNLWLHAGFRNIVSLKIIGTIQPDEYSKKTSAVLRDCVYNLLSEHVTK